MAECNKDLQKAGAAYPRTCAQCGLSKCTKYPDPADPTSGAEAYAVFGPMGKLVAIAMTKERADDLAGVADGHHEKAKIL